MTAALSVVPTDDATDVTDVPTEDTTLADVTEAFETLKDAETADRIQTKSAAEIAQEVEVAYRRVSVAITAAYAQGHTIAEVLAAQAEASGEVKEDGTPKPMASGLFGKYTIVGNVLAKVGADHLPANWVIRPVSTGGKGKSFVAQIDANGDVIVAGGVVQMVAVRSIYSVVQKALLNKATYEDETGKIRRVGGKKVVDDALAETTTVRQALDVLVRIADYVEPKAAKSALDRVLATVGTLTSAGDPAKTPELGEEDELRNAIAQITGLLDTISGRLTV